MLYEVITIALADEDGNNEGRAEFNATAAQALGARWSTMVLAHGSTFVITSYSIHYTKLYEEQP